MNFRKGDTVTITAVVAYDDGESVRVVVDGGADVWVISKNITLKQPAFQVGDWCSWGNGDDKLFKGEILAIADGHAWITYRVGDYCTRALTSIDRCEPPAEGLQ